MDVEGYEYEIFRGMPQTLKKNIKILVELHPHLISDKLNEIFQILEQNNFKVQFAVFENKVVENKILRFLMKKAGENLPLIVSNMSVQELKCLMAMNPTLSPNVIFEKNITK